MSAGYRRIVDQDIDRFAFQLFRQRVNADVIGYVELHDAKFRVISLNCLKVISSIWFTCGGNDVPVAISINSCDFQILLFGDLLEILVSDCLEFDKILFVC